ncbi:hypothetical protein SEA_MARKY_13 [Streptomyces phage Marky]|nr:hypothetical protein SEA_MARKY_13 [Streptomyces phage Marky]
MAKLVFKTVQTTYGKLHTMRTLDQNGGTLAEYRVLTHTPTAAELSPVFPVVKYLAANGSAWAMAMCKSGALVAWKSTKISKRFGLEQYRMRSVPGGYKGDFVKSWSRAFNGKTYSFSRIFWNAGKDGWTINVYEGQSTKIVKTWSSSAPVKMK